MDKSPRETMAGLPCFIQPFLTWLTGMPLAGQSPLFNWFPITVALCTMAEIIFGILIGVYALNISLWIGIFPLILSWILVTGGMRMFFTVIEHACSHHRFNQNSEFSLKKKINRVIADIISVLCWVESYYDFRHGHTIHHQATRLPQDPENIFLYQCGFFAGMSSKEIVWQLIKTILSPMMYMRVFIENTKSNFKGHLYRKFFSAGYLCMVFYIVITFDIALYFVVLWLMPILIFSPISMVVNTLTEHRWPKVGKKNVGVYVGRFCGDPVPNTNDASFMRWAYLWSVWWMRILFLHLPYRLSVVVGDLPQHDLHHRFPATDWVQATYIRYNYIHTGKMKGYTDVWGSVIDHIYDSASRPN